MVINVVHQHDPRQAVGAVAGECPVRYGSHRGFRDTTPTDVGRNPVANLTALASADLAAVAVRQRNLAAYTRSVASRAAAASSGARAPWRIW